jgi:hypothetical protein
LVDINMSPGDESWGLIRPYDFSKRPAFESYKNTIKYLAGFQYPIRREQSGNHYLFSFQRPQGVTRIMWARNQAAVSLNVPALADSGILVDPVTGTETAVTPVGGVYNIRLPGARCHGECLMGGAPVFLVEEGVTAESLPNSAPPIVEAPAVTATSALSSTTAVTTTATLSASSAVITATETATLTPTKTKTPRPTATNTASATATETATAVPPTATAAATSVAALVATNPPALGSESGEMEDGDTAMAGVLPENQASFWFLAIGVGLMLGLVIFIKRR